MYPFIQSSSSSNEGRKSPANNYFDNVVNRELDIGFSVRKTMRGPLGNRFQIKNAKAAEATHTMEISLLRRQIKALPQLLKEDMYNNYQSAKVTKINDSDDFQYMMIFRLGGIIRKQYCESGMGPLSFRIGGICMCIYKYMYVIHIYSYIDIFMYTYIYIYICMYVL
jgi:hypothetical protein